MLSRKISGRINIALLYFSYHIMVGLGTIFIAIMVVAVFLLTRNTLYDSRWMLWILMLSRPASLHRQHRRVDDRRTRPPALAHLRPDAHRSRLFTSRC